MAHVPVQKIPCDIATANAALGAHKKGERVRELIEKRGCELLFLPPYSPDLNPIEEAFSKVKGLLRRAGARRTRKALTEAMGRALDV